MGNTRPWSDERIEEFKQRWHAGERPIEIRRAMGLTPGQLAGKARILHLHRPRGRGKGLAPGNSALVDGRSKFHRASVIVGDPAPLKSGDNQIKVGAKVTKGRLKGARIFTLSLEERATCPRSCANWSTCYGNHMPYSKRHFHGAELEKNIEAQLADLFASKRGRRPSPILLRLHILGDFYSIEYVEFWKRMLAKFRKLYIFGYTAWPLHSPIGVKIASLRATRWNRFAIRTSGAKTGTRTLVIEEESEAPDGAIICPAQTVTRISVSCGTCALCWQTKKPIAFLRH